MFRLRRWPASPAKDHLSNSLVFGPDGKLYMTQGSNSAMGDPDPAWYKRSERLLNGSVLDPQLTPPIGGFNVQTENYVNSSNVTTTGNYNPYATDAPVKIFLRRCSQCLRFSLAQ